MEKDKSKKIQLLDCTLRDGGYINDWNFGRENLISVFERLVDAGVDIIEIGFLDDRRPFDIDRSIMPDTDGVSKIYGNLDKKSTLVVGMIDYGTCPLENIKPCGQSFLDGIRVIFKKNLRRQALAFCAELKKLGYVVFAQLVSVTSYSDEEFYDLINLANETRPDAVSMVDTYGLMHQDNVLHYFKLLDEGLSPDIKIGYHAHNNFQMAYANCIAFLMAKTERPLVVDGTLFGMGKSAGNAPIELLAMYLNQNFGRQFAAGQLLEAIDAIILPIYGHTNWGYNIFYYLAASNDCHPNYVSYLVQKRTLSINSVNEILSRLDGEKKLLYDKNYIERLYIEYQSCEIGDGEDVKRLAETLKDKNICILCPGASIKKYKTQIKTYIKENNCLTVAVNFIPYGIDVDYVFISNSKRYVHMASELARGRYKIIATSNITQTGKSDFAFVMNYGGLIDSTAEIVDNSLVMLLKLLIKSGISLAALAGGDGYSPEKINYFVKNMEYDFIKNKAEYLNNYTRDFLNRVKDELKVKFITPSEYEK